MKKVTTNTKKFKKADSGTNIPGEQQLKGTTSPAWYQQDSWQNDSGSLQVNNPLKAKNWNPPGGVNTNDLLTGSLGLISSLLPNTPVNSNQNRMQEAYNPNPNGTGSQAIFREGGKIADHSYIKGRTNISNGTGANSFQSGFVGVNSYNNQPNDTSYSYINKQPGLEENIFLNTQIDPSTGQPVNTMNRNGVIGTVPQDSVGFFKNKAASIAEFKDGGSIHIKPENKGKFTAYKKRTGKTTEEALHSKDPHVRKMANFAKNAKKWNHKAADGDYIPLSAQDKENWNAFHSDLAHNNPNYGSDFLNHNTNSESSIQAWNAANPGRQISRPIADYQKEFDVTPLGRSKVDSFGTTNNQEVGRLTGASSFRQYEYSHLDKNGKEIGHINPSVTPLTSDQFSNWQEHNRNGQWTSNDQGIPMPQDTPVNNSIPNPIASTPGLTRPQKSNWHTNEDANYSIDSIRAGNDDEAYYGGKMMAANGVQVEDNQYKMLSPHTAELGGEYHSNGGTDVQYGDQTVEGQKGEPMAITNDGSLNLFGKMYIPGTNTKFDTAARKIAKGEDKVAKSNTKVNDLLEDVDPTNKYGRLTFGSAKVTLDGNTQNMRDLNNQKEALASIQNTMHRMADDMGVEPQKVSTELKARYGMSIGKGKMFEKMDYKDINDTVALIPDFLGTAKDGAIMKMQRQMMGDHPEWVQEALAKYGQPNAKRFDDGLDGPRTQFVKNYIAKKASGQSSSTSNGVSSRTFGVDEFDPTNSNLPPTGRGDLFDNIKNAPFDPNNTGVVAPMANDIAPWRANMTDKEAQDNINNRIKPVGPYAKTPTTKPFKNRLGVWDILPEAMTAFDQVEPVPGHTINSYLQTPYNVSFQDRRNDNMSVFNAASKTQTGNPATIGALAGQEYVANNNVNADEFRTNQGIYNQITNENYNTLNADKKMQLQLDMDQEQKQALAKSYTKRDKFNAISSLADKNSAVQRSNFTNSMYNSMFHSNGVDAYGRPLHVDNAYFPTPTVGMADLYDDAERKHIIKKYGIDPYTKKKVSEDVEVVKTTSKFGKKIPKKLPSSYGKL